MATNDRDRNLSLIPYSSNQNEVILRHGNAVVTRDPRSQEVTLRETRAETVEYGKCPMCQRGYGADDPFHRDDSPGTHDSYLDPEYFRLLAQHSHRGSPAHSPSPSRTIRASRSSSRPRRTLYRQVTNTEAEFVSSSPTGPSAEKTGQNIKHSSFLPGYFKQFFEERCILGRGGRGLVLLVEHKLDGVSLGEFACKRIPVGNDHDWLAKVLVEVQLLQRLNHPNLVSYRHVWLEDAQPASFGPSVPCVFILQQYCNAGDLHRYVQAQDRSTLFSDRNTSARHRLPGRATPMTLDDILSFFKDITNGLHHLHANGYIHRDLKPSNCLLNIEHGRISVHVSDFGEVQAATAKRASTGATGTISYCAPEVLQRETPDGAYGNFTTKSDIFSLGMILFYMCFATLPYSHADINEENEDLDLLRAEIAAWQGFSAAARRRQDLPDKLYDVLRRLLSVNPADRPTTADILATAGAEEGNGNRRPSVRDPPARPSPTFAPTGVGESAVVTDSEEENDRTMSISLAEKPRPPQLLLPAPPHSQYYVPRLTPDTPLFRILLFAIKIIALLYPCTPFAPRPILLYPLLALAAYDLAIPYNTSWTIASLLIHLAILGPAWTSGIGICAA